MKISFKSVKTTFEDLFVGDTFLVNDSEVWIKTPYLQYFNSGKYVSSTGKYVNAMRMDSLKFEHFPGEYEVNKVDAEVVVYC